MENPIWSQHIPGKCARISDKNINMDDRPKTVESNRKEVTDFMEISLSKTLKTFLSVGRRSIKKVSGGAEHSKVINSKK